MTHQVIVGDAAGILTLTLNRPEKQEDALLTGFGPRLSR